jgi:hypothetical protein
MKTKAVAGAKAPALQHHGGRGAIVGFRSLNPTYEKDCEMTGTRKERE